MSTPPRLAVFDCDGTLVDGQHDIISAMDEAFAALGLAAPGRTAITRIVGLSLPQAMRRLLPEGEPQVQAALVEAYKQAFRTARAEGRLGEPLYDGIREPLDDLRAAGWDLAVATGKSDRGWRIALPRTD
jgi:phosphoglycolate phosphatase